MDGFADERDFRLLEKDKYAFFVLRRILADGSQTLLLTDHERLILCFTRSPYPVWIWTPDGATEADMERAYRAAAEHALMDGGYRFNLKPELAQYFIARAAADGRAFSVSMRMLAYDCLNPVKPADAADGCMARCADRDLGELVEFMELFHREIGIDQRSREEYRRDAQAHLRAGSMFFWQDARGNRVASCKLTQDGDGMASIGSVYTRPEFRRKHYAENLVYQVTKRARDAGTVPTLYTNADYAASNACYRKIGYALRGELCTIAQIEGPDGP